MVARETRALRLMVAGDAFRVIAAVELVARIDALSIETVAVLVRWTIFVVLANILAFLVVYKIVRINLSLFCRVEI